jgi:transposase
MAQDDMFPDEPVKESQPQDQQKRKPPLKIKEVNRKQMCIRAVDVENLIPETHTARAVWDFVSQLDLAGYYSDVQSIQGESGRPIYDRKLLVSLWLYAYTDGVGNAREIERRCGHDPAYQWLTGMEVISYHTLSNFRVQNQAALDELFTKSLAILSFEGMVEMKVAAQDGVKIKASAGTDTFRSKKTIQEHLQQAQEQIQALSNIDEPSEMNKAHQARLQAKIQRKNRIQAALQQMEKLSKNHPAEKQEALRISETDPEARKMKEANGGYAPNYNAQITADAANGIIIAARVSQSSSDFKELAPSLEQIQKNCGRLPDQLITDAGFSSRENVLLMAENNVDYIAPTLKVAATAGQFDRRGIAPEFRTEAFQYHPETNSFSCPQSKTLHFRTKRARIGTIEHSYQAKFSDCQQCPFKQQCCPQNTHNGRSIVRTELLPVVQNFVQKMSQPEAKTIYKQRGQIIEFCNAWIKTKIGLRQFHVRGLIKVTMELIWASLAYNIKQWIRLRWLPAIVAGKTN